MRRNRRCARGRLLLVLAVLPALVFGPALGGAAVRLHSQGTSGGHLHLLAAQIDDAGLGALHEWHDAQHRHVHDSGTHEEGEGEEPTPKGLLIKLPQILAAPPRGSTPAAAAVFQVPALLPSPRWHLVPAGGTHRPALRCSDWLPQRAKRSGVVALLRSSHALLI